MDEKFGGPVGAKKEQSTLLTTKVIQSHEVEQHRGVIVLTLQRIIIRSNLLFAPTMKQEHFDFDYKFL